MLTSPMYPLCSQYVGLSENRIPLQKRKIATLLQTNIDVDNYKTYQLYIDHFLWVFQIYFSFLLGQLRVPHFLVCLP